jgi:hypothetical protein
MSTPQPDVQSKSQPDEQSEARLVAYDYSGSTSGSAFYHDTVQQILGQYEPYDVILWDSRVEVSNANALRQINHNRCGRGGTEPKVVAKYCVKQQTRGQLILITDGQILPRDVEQLDAFLNGHSMVISTLDCYLIQSHEHYRLDATVIAPFLRRFPHRVFLCESKTAETVVIASGGGTLDELLEEIRSIGTISEFQNQFDHLFNEILTKMLGIANDHRLHDEILVLQRRLLNEMKRLPRDFDELALRQAFKDRNEAEQIRLGSELFRLYETNWHEPTWPPQLFHLLRMVTGNLGSVYSITALASRFQANRVQRAEVVENIELSEVQIIDGSQSFTCPISYEEESDIVILIRKPTEGLLAGEPRELANSVITNPLSALRYPEFCAKLIRHIDHPIALRSMKEAEEAGYPITQSPLTRAPILGGLFLGASEEHARATNFALAHLSAEGKRVGHPDLWFMLIWWLIERGEVKHLESVLPQIRAHMCFRLTNHLGTLTLTNTPYFPITLVPLGIAIWCTLSSISLGIPQDQAIQYLKCHSSHIDVFEAAIGLVKYELPSSSRDLLIKWRAFGEIRKEITRGNSQLHLWAIRACYNVVHLNRSAIRSALFTRIVDEIPIDGDPPLEQVNEALQHLPEWFVQSSPQRRRAIVRMLQFTDLNKITYADFDFEVPEFGWQYGVREFQIPEVPICDATCRPYYVDPTKQIVWSEASSSIFGEVQQQIHIHWYFIECVTKLKVFPTKEEFLLFVFNNIVPKHKSTLPFLIQRFVDVVFNGYESIVAQFNAPTFISRTMHSIRVGKRKSIESGVSQQPSVPEQPSKSAGGVRKVDRKPRRPVKRRRHGGTP